MKRYRVGMLALVVVLLVSGVALADPFGDYLTSRGEASCMAYGDLIVQYMPLMNMSDEVRTYYADTFASLPFDSQEWNIWLQDFDDAVRP